MLMRLVRLGQPSPRPATGKTWSGKPIRSEISRA
jgi:hypothetical protein